MAQIDKSNKSNYCDMCNAQCQTCCECWERYWPSTPQDEVECQYKCPHSGICGRCVYPSFPGGLRYPSCSKCGIRVCEKHEPSLNDEGLCSKCRVENQDEEKEIDVQFDYNEECSYKYCDALHDANTNGSNCIQCNVWVCDNHTVSMQIVDICTGKRLCDACLCSDKN